MPPFTPSRIAVVAVALSLIGFLWTFALPYPHASPAARPIISHDAPIAPHRVQERPPGPLFTPLADQEVEELEEEPYTPSPTTASVSPGTSCKEVRGAADILVVVRTSKSRARLSPSLKSFLACVPNAVFFSDHTGTLDGYPVYDALESISHNASTLYDEFRDYRKFTADKEARPSAEQAQKLDKWKFLPMVYKAFQAQPHHRFYLFVEHDTKLTWTNVLQWTARLDYRMPYYTGAHLFSGTRKFAQGSPGILLSWGALRLYAKTYEERYAEEWEPHVGHDCCGDVLLAYAMAESSVEFVSSFPLLQNESPATLDWNNRHWCAPVVSWGHVADDEGERLWESQQAWTKAKGWDMPYLSRNAFQELILPRLADQKVDWDNISSDTHITAQPGVQAKLAKEKAEKAQQQERTQTSSPHPLRVQTISASLPKTTGRRQHQPIKSEPAHSTLPKDTQDAAPKLTNISNPSLTTSSDLNSLKRDSYPRAQPVGWEKLGEQIKKAADSVSNCRDVCHKTADCLQWKYTTKGDGECHLGRVLRLGRAAKKSADGKEVWTSGWVVERVKKLTEGWGNCESVNWRFNQ